jgi:GNAT superfamily N-acetyltransferase
MYSFQAVNGHPDSLKKYAVLFKACFPTATHLDAAYLNWLYNLNPCGGVVGIDAFAGDSLAAHYACVPVDAWHEGQPVRALLSLNTATHPEHQGKGLFTRLAEMTYDAGHAAGATVVFGVANANSTPGFVRKLGFQLVSPLDARLALGRPVVVNRDEAVARAQFRRVWTEEQLQWRMANPANPLRLSRNDAHGSTLLSRTGYLGIYAWGETSVHLGEKAQVSSPLSPGRLFLGLYPSGTWRNGVGAKIPDRFRPSPLNLIFRHLNASASVLSAEHVCFNYLDFDAY